MLKTVLADGIKAHDSYNGSEGRTMALIWEKTNIKRKVYVVYVAVTTSFVRLQAITKLMDNFVKQILWAKYVFEEKGSPRVLFVVFTWAEMSFYNMIFSFLVNKHTISGN